MLELEVTTFNLLFVVGVSYYLLIGFTLGISRVLRERKNVVITMLLMTFLWPVAFLI